MNSAARKSHTRVAKALSQERANIKATSKNRYTLLIGAANTISHPELVKIFKRANKKAINKNRWTLLRLVIKRGNVKLVKAILKIRTRAETTAYDGYTPLMAAVYIGYTKIVKLLLKNWANTEATDKDGSTLLNWAARTGILLLLDKKAKMEVTDKNRSTPLSLVIKNGYFAEVEILLEKRAS